MKETGVQIYVPPLSMYSDEISVSGDKEGVQLAIEKINDIHTRMVCKIFNLIYVHLLIVLNLNCVKHLII